MTSKMKVVIIASTVDVDQAVCTSSHALRTYHDGAGQQMARQCNLLYECIVRIILSTSYTQVCFKDTCTVLHLGQSLVTSVSHFSFVVLLATTLSYYLLD